MAGAVRRMLRRASNIGKEEPSFSRPTPINSLACLTRLRYGFLSGNGGQNRPILDTDFSEARCLSRPHESDRAVGFQTPLRGVPGLRHCAPVVTRSRSVAQSGAVYLMVLVDGTFPKGQRGRQL